MSNVSANFSVDWAMKVLYYIPTDNKDIYTTKKNTLFNIGNLNFLFENGELYDKTKNQTYADKIKKRFDLVDDDQFLVFWGYMKYFVRGFAENQ